MAYDPRFTITRHLLTLIEEISVFREKILSATIQVPWIPALQKDARTRNTHSSTAIEGNPLTLEEVGFLGEGQDLPGKTQRAKQEVLNYFTALRHIEKHTGQKSISHADILRLHALISTGVMDQGQSGKYRGISVRVGHFLPPAPSLVSGLMAELIEWWNKRSIGWSPIVTSAIIHFRFEDIHPFGDANGRTGRLLALWELYRRGFDSKHIFSLDEFFWENRPLYYQNLEAVRHHGGDLTGWLEFTAEGLHLTLEKVWMRVQKLKAKGKEKIVLRPKQEQLLVLLRERHGLAPKEIWEALKVSKQGAMDLLRPLLEAGMIQRIGSKKTGKYILKGEE